METERPKRDSEKCPFFGGENLERIKMKIGGKKNGIIKHGAHVGNNYFSGVGSDHSLYDGGYIFETQESGADQDGCLSTDTESRAYVSGIRTGKTENEMGRITGQKASTPMGTGIDF